EFSNLQMHHEAIGVKPGLLPSGVPGAQPGSENNGRRRAPPCLPCKRRSVGRGAIGSTGRIFMRNTLWLTAVAALALVAQSGPDRAAAQTRTTLDIYVVDVEGGNATLLVAPSGESLLIDTGNVAPAAAIRDAERIMAATKDAGLTRIDNLITTHWHGDHYGGMGELARAK